MSYAERHAREIAADEAMASIDWDASDLIIAGIVADYLVAQLPSSRIYHLGVGHNASALCNLERIGKFNPHYQPNEPVGPCALPYDWTYKNVVGISTRDRERARRWIIEAQLAGYGVFRRWGRQDGGFGCGSIAAIRQRGRPRDEARSAACLPVATAPLRE
jgi:hypothetical protein